MVITHAGGSPLEGRLFGMPQKHVNLDEVLWEERITHRQTWGQYLPMSLVRFPQHWGNPIPDSLPYLLAKVLLFTWTHSKGKHKTVIWNSRMHRATSLGAGLAEASVGTGAAERAVQHKQGEKPFYPLQLLRSGEGASFSKEQMLHKTCPLNPFEGSVTCESICSISRRKLFPEQMPMFYVYCIC